MVSGRGKEAVEAGDRRYWELFEFAPEAYVVSDRAGTIRAGNRAARALLDRESAPLIGSSIYDLVAEGDREAFQRAIDSLVQGGWPLQPVELNVHLATPGRPRVVQMTVSDLPDDVDPPGAMAWIIHPSSGVALAPKVAVTTAPRHSTQDVARQVDEGLLPVVGAVGLILRHPGLPPDLKLALAEAAVALDGAVQWMGKLERVATGEPLPS